MKKHILFGMMIAVFFSGCAWFERWFEHTEEKTAHELVNDGISDYRDGNYKDALESFEKLKDWYPFSKYAILAELKIADAHYNLKQYDEAVIAYEDFENLHPRNEAIPYIVYQIGSCYFRQIETVDRDQNNAKKAFKIFNRLKKQFPDSVYAVKARENIKQCLKSLAGHDLYVGLFYYKSKHYKAALDRFKSIITNYADVGIHNEALKYIVLCEATIKEQTE
ncbi:outer membrane protein assembly factor BamD [Desulfococcaceae bacterium HSG9]|nr:outer membrane protein assembly factor BamD [Desulfococcaceae bacterium HSG9]